MMVDFIEKQKKDVETNTTAFFSWQEKYSNKKKNFKSKIYSHV